MLEYVELNSEASRVISAQNTGGYMISFDSIYDYASTVDVGATNANILILARCSSLKTLFSLYIDFNRILAYKTISNRANPIADVGQW